MPLLIEKSKLSNTNHQCYQIFRKNLTKNPKPNKSVINMSRNLVSGKLTSYVHNRVFCQRLSHSKLHGNYYVLWKGFKFAVSESLTVLNAVNPCSLLSHSSNKTGFHTAKKISVLPKVYICALCLEEN